MKAALLWMAICAAAPAQDVDISNGRKFPGQQEPQRRQEAGFVATMSFGPLTVREGRDARASAGLQWSWLLYSKMGIDVQYTAEGRPFFYVRRPDAPGTTGWSLSPVGLRARTRFFYGEVLAGVARVELNDAERTFNRNKFSPMLEAGGGVQLGNPQGLHTRLGYRYLRGWPGGTGDTNHLTYFTSHSFSGGVFFAFGR